MTTTTCVGDFVCPVCGQGSDVAAVDGDGPPTHGDISICLSCYALRWFVFEGLRFVGYRLLTDADLEALPAEDREALDKAQAMARVMRSAWKPS